MTKPERYYPKGFVAAMQDDGTPERKAEIREWLVTALDGWSSERWRDIATWCDNVIPKITEGTWFYFEPMNPLRGPFTMLDQVFHEAYDLG